MPSTMNWMSSLALAVVGLKSSNEDWKEPAVGATILPATCKRGGT